MLENTNSPNKCQSFDLPLLILTSRHLDNWRPLGGESFDLTDILPYLSSMQMGLLTRNQGQLYRFIILLLFLLISHPSCGGTFRIATYNVENFLDYPRGSRNAKSKEARNKIMESLLTLRADVLALQEMGGTNALEGVRSSLSQAGLVYPYWELVTGFDTNIQIAVLSRFSIVRRQAHTNDAYLLMGRRFRVSRGFLEIDIEPSPSYRFTLFTAHLKSRRPVAFADESEMRFKEAELLRKKIDDRLAKEPDANIVVLGDLNDVKDSRPVRILMGRGRKAFIDTRPTEANGDTSRIGISPSRSVAWTHFYGQEDTYSRIDYILASPGMALEWQPQGTYILAIPNWGVGSDHRPITATFSDDDK